MVAIARGDHRLSVSGRPGGLVPGLVCRLTSRKPHDARATLAGFRKGGDFVINPEEVYGFEFSARPDYKAHFGIGAVPAQFVGRTADNTLEVTVRAARDIPAPRVGDEVTIVLERIGGSMELKGIIRGWRQDVSGGWSEDAPVFDATIEIDLLD